MSSEKIHISTKLLHGGYAPDAETGATATPIVQSTAFATGTAEELEAIFKGRDAGYVYSRINNPTLTALERRITALEEGLGAIACASGMAAISSTVLTLAGSGDEIISGNSIFGGTYSLFQNTLSQYGIKTIFAESTDIDAFKKAISDKTKLIFIETIGNPKLDVPNIASIASIARENGIPLVVDSTVTTPVLIQPKKLGANIVIHSASKFINGHGNSIGGLIVDCGNFDWSFARFSHLAEFYKKTKNFAFLAASRNRFHKDLGFCMSPFNSFLLLTGIESLAVRMERHCSNAQKVAEFLSTHKEVEETNYPGLPNNPNFNIATKQFGSLYGAILTLRLRTKERCFKFINNLKLAQNLANLGDTKTLVIHPASTICIDATEEERKAMGVTDDLVRFSIGLEHIDDILNDIEESLKQLGD